MPLIHSTTTSGVGGGILNLLLFVFMVLTRGTMQQERIPEDIVFPGDAISPMANYQPSASCPNCPKDFRILDCWQCFEAQGKVCMDKDHGSLFNVLQTSKQSSVFCCKQDYNEGFCKDGYVHGSESEANRLEMVCSPPSFISTNFGAGSFAAVTTGNRNHQMYAYCPKINQKKCGIKDGTDSKDMRLLAGTEKVAVQATELKYLKQGYDPVLGGIGSEKAEYDSCYYEVVMDEKILEKWDPTKINLKFTKKTAGLNVYIYGGKSRQQATKSLTASNRQVNSGESFSISSDNGFLIVAYPNDSTDQDLSFEYWVDAKLKPPPGSEPVKVVKEPEPEVKAPHVEEQKEIDMTFIILCAVAACILLFIVGICIWQKNKNKKKSLISNQRQMQDLDLDEEANSQLGDTFRQSGLDDPQFHFTSQKLSKGGKNQDSDLFEEPMEEEDSSDIVKEEDLPEPIQEPVISIIADQIDTYYKKFETLMINSIINTLRIEKEMIQNLKGPDRTVTEQFLCLICDNMIIPKFAIDDEGNIEKSSIKIPQCQACDGLACYSCWRDYVDEGNKKCPSCHNVIEKRTIMTPPGSRISRLNETNDAFMADSKEPPEKLKDFDFDKQTIFCSQKLLINILFEQQIIHKCKLQSPGALTKAQELWSSCVENVKEFVQSNQDCLSEGEESIPMKSQYEKIFGHEAIAVDSSRDDEEDDEELSKNGSGPQGSDEDQDHFEEGGHQEQIDEAERVLEQLEHGAILDQDINEGNNSREYVENESPQLRQLKSAVKRFLLIFNYKYDQFTTYSKLEREEKNLLAELAKYECTKIIKEHRKEMGQSKQSDLNNSIEQYVEDIQDITKDGDDYDEMDFERQKGSMMEVLASTLYKTHYKYLEYLFYELADSVNRPTVQGCQMENCKRKKRMDFKEFRKHFFQDCKKIMLECSLCKEQFPRSYMDRHDCRRIYMKRLDVTQKTQKDIISNFEQTIAEKSRIIKEYEALEESRKHNTMDSDDLNDRFFENAEKFLEIPQTEEKKEMLSVGIQPSPMQKIEVNSVSVGQTQVSQRSHSMLQFQSQTPKQPSKPSKHSQFDDNSKWRLKRQIRVQKDKQYQIKDYIAILHSIESEVASIDNYAQYCTNKYRPFMFNIQYFMNDDIIAQAKFIEFFKVKSGQFKGNIYFGFHLDKAEEFTPHGFGLLVNEKSKTLQIGTFKIGKEISQQRLIQCHPIKSRSMIQFTSNLGRLHGPALVERADGRVEIGEYKEDKQHGVWRYRYIDGKQESRVFDNGKSIKKS